MFNKPKKEVKKEVKKVVVEQTWLDPEAGIVIKEEK